MLNVMSEENSVVRSQNHPKKCIFNITDSYIRLSRNI